MTSTFFFDHHLCFLNLFSYSCDHINITSSYYLSLLLILANLFLSDLD